jgi:hypothetical protein
MWPLVCRSGWLSNPELANDPKIAAQLLAAFLKDKEDRILDALDKNDFAEARRLVNGGRHRLPEFTDAYERGSTFLSKRTTAQSLLFSEKSLVVKDEIEPGSLLLLVFC